MENISASAVASAAAVENISLISTTISSAVENISASASAVASAAAVENISLILTTISSALDGVVASNSLILKEVKADKKVSSKRGSEMTATILRCIPSIESDIRTVYNGLLENNSHSECLRQCQSLLWNYTTVSDKYKRNREFAEVDYVQPRSFELLKSLFKEVLPLYFNDLMFCRKGKEEGGQSTKIAYHTVVHSDESSCNINGECDISVYFKNVCIFVWEDKNLNLKLTTPGEKGEIIVEVKGFAESFKTTIISEAGIFCGVETTGLIWRFCFRRFEDGNVYFVNTDPFEISNEEEAGILALLLIDSVSSSERLIRSIRDKCTKVTKPPTNADNNENDEDGNGKEPDTGFDTDLDKTLGEKFSELGLPSSSSANRQSADKASNRAAYMKDSGESRKRLPLREINGNQLTRDNLYLLERQQRSKNI